jgi:hypothetical protein
MKYSNKPKAKRPKINIRLFEEQLRIILKRYDDLVIEKLSYDGVVKTFFVLLRKNLKLAKIIKINPINTNELVISYYEDNILQYESLLEKDILPIDQYEITKERRNKINNILKNEE